MMTPSTKRERSHRVPDLLTDVRPYWNAIEAVVKDNQVRVLNAFRAGGMTSQDLAGTTGYGYDDHGRERLDRILAQIFGAEAALVRAQWASGTHALITALRAALMPGDELWVAGAPVYETLHPFLYGPGPGSLPSLGVTVRDVALTAQGRPAWPESGPRRSPRVIYIQRSRGYQLRPSWGREQILPIVEHAHGLGAWVIVDNCYGEFTDREEPTQWGADLAVGSLLKNPGGGLAPTGGYVAGRADLVRRVADALFGPGLGAEIGPTLSVQRLMAQGLFLAPTVVGEALMGGVYVSHLFDRAGYPVDPPAAVKQRQDIVTAIELGSPDKVLQFCRAIQAMSPVDAHVLPEPWAMPGYRHPVIMAAGGFVAGGSLELSADAPMAPPYRVYVQGGLSRWHTVAAADAALKALSEHDQ